MMVFITAGTQLSFDRLIKTMDELARTLPKVKFVAQALTTTHTTKHLELLNFISAQQFNDYVDEADLIVSHAGTGTIFTALVKKKPIIVMPRLVKYNEHRNEHQLGTCKKMDSMGYVHVAYDEVQLKEMFLQMWPHNLTVRNANVTDNASLELLSSLDHYIKHL